MFVITRLTKNCTHCFKPIAKTLGCTKECKAIQYEIKHDWSLIVYVDLLSLNKRIRTTPFRLIQSHNLHMHIHIHGYAYTWHFRYQFRGSFRGPSNVGPVEASLSFSHLSKTRLYSHKCASLFSVVVHKFVGWSLRLLASCHWCLHGSSLLRTVTKMPVHLLSSAQVSTSTFINLYQTALYFTAKLPCTFSLFQRAWGVSTLAWPNTCLNPTAAVPVATLRLVLTIFSDSYSSYTGRVF